MISKGRLEPEKGRQMKTTGNVGIALLVGLLGSLPAATGCSREQDDRDRPATQRSERKQTGTISADPAMAVKRVHLRDGAATLRFDVNWPPVDPAEAKRIGVKYLDGELNVRCGAGGETDGRLIVGLTLSRPHGTDADRTGWNRKTSFPQYRHWMPYVWDSDEKWLWPNLAYLFKLHGIDREERYGGWDPGHNVDNDFAGVLIRKYDARGEREHSDTKDAGPLVSANWHEVGVKDADRDTVVHVTASDRFTVHLARKDPPASGRLKIWFIYGDLMRQRPPATWPTKRECNGATIALFHIDWEFARRGDPKVAIVQKIPPVHTGFDWQAWVGRTSEHGAADGRARLTDR